jgi:RNA 3'-terminal phosphate cyclase (ATP)
VRAEEVAEEAVRALEPWLHSDAPVGEHLADQLLLPMAVAGAGALRVVAWSSHARTNAEVIARFLPLRFAVVAEAGTEVAVTCEPVVG